MTYKMDLVSLFDLYNNNCIAISAFCHLKSNLHDQFVEKGRIRPLILSDIKKGGVSQAPYNKAGLNKNSATYIWSFLTVKNCIKNI